jgi:quinohemoprotein ethanol dehydrogenase
MTRFALLLCSVLFFLCACGAGLQAPSVADTDTDTVTVADVTSQRIINADSEPQNWLSHGRSYTEERFSPLTVVNDSNVDELGLAWFLDLGTNRGLEATPIVVDGVMYVSGAWNIVHAINAATGELIWRYDPQVSRPWVAAHACCDAVSRGVAVWQGKVLAATLDGRLLALDAVSGELLWETLTVDKDKPYTITGAPRVVNNKVLIGNSGADYGVRGYLSAYDVGTGERVWRFYTVPGDPSKPQESAALEKAVKTWSGDEWVRTGGGGTVWNSMAYDAALNLLYFGTGNGTPWSREQRSPGGGDNLFLSSVIAVNADTGEYVWHYQTTPGESWNFSAVESIVLTQLKINDESRDVLIQAPKNGFFYVLDRRTGELLSAENYIPLNWASHVDPETGRPVEYPYARYKDQGRLVVPGPSGGHSWYPMSYSPLTGLAYIPALSVPGYYHQNGAYQYQPGYQNTGIEEGVTNFKALNPQGERQRIRFSVQLLAWNPATRSAAWRVDLPDLGGGTLATAGNLVFQGQGTGEFAAYRADTGDKLWSFAGGTTIMPGPVSYAVDGEQYIAVLAGRGGGSGLVGGPMGRAWQGVVNENRVLAFKLNGTAELPARRTVTQSADVPPELLAEADDESAVTRGKHLYEQYCYMCHGIEAMSGGVIPDLRFAGAATLRNWNAIVIGGLREQQGMRSFAEVMNDTDALAIRAYILSR